jgi:hypothetical protein
MAERIIFFVRGDHIGRKSLGAFVKNFLTKQGKHA